MIARLITFGIILKTFLLFSCSNESDSSPTPELLPHVGTLAGGEQGFEDGPAQQAKFYEPSEITLTPAGDLYVIDQKRTAIRKISQDGIVSTVFSTSKLLRSITSDYDGNIYFTDGQFIGKLVGNTVDTVDIDVYASGVPVYYDIAEGGMAFHPDGFIYAASTNSTIVKISVDGMVTKFCGGQNGYKDGSIDQAEFSYRNGLAISKEGEFYISDFMNHRIRKISSGIVSTIAGSEFGYNDGPAATARFTHPLGMVATPDGTIYVCAGHLIRKISSGEVSTIAGGTAGYFDSIGRSAAFSSPLSLALASDGSIYVSDTNNHRIRKIVFK